MTRPLFSNEGAPVQDQPACPSCQTASVEVQGPGRAHCTWCRSRFHPFAEITAPLAEVGLDPATLRELVLHQSRQTLPCPTSGTLLRTVEVRGVKIHISAAHQAVWLEDDALDRLRNPGRPAARAPGGQAAPPLAAGHTSVTAHGLPHANQAGEGSLDLDLSGRGGEARNPFAQPAPTGPASHPFAQPPAPASNPFAQPPAPASNPFAPSPGGASPGVPDIFGGASGPAYGDGAEGNSPYGSGSFLGESPAPPAGGRSPYGGGGSPYGGGGSPYGGGSGGSPYGGQDDHSYGSPGGGYAGGDGAGSFPSAPLDDNGGPGGPPPGTPDIYRKLSGAKESRFSFVGTGAVLKIGAGLLIAGALYFVYDQIAGRLDWPVYEIDWGYTVEMPAKPKPELYKRDFEDGTFDVLEMKNEGGSRFIVVWGQAWDRAERAVHGVAYEIAGRNLNVEKEQRKAGKLTYYEASQRNSPPFNVATTARLWFDDDGHFFFTASIADTLFYTQNAPSTRFVRSLKPPGKKPAASN